MHRSILLFALCLPSIALASPVLVHQARLTDASGAPINGSVTVELQLFDAATGGAFFTQPTTVDATNGYIAVVLGADPNNPLDPIDLADGETWLETRVDTVLLGGRVRLASVPHAAAAAIAQSATSVTGGTVDASALSIGGTPFIDESGAIVGDLHIDGNLTTDGITFPYVVSIDDHSWLDEDKVILNGAAESLTSNGNLSVGTSFSGSNSYLTIPILAPGALPNGRYRVETVWRRLCRTTDCDTNTRLVDGNTVGWEITTQDNDGGGSIMRNPDGSASVTTLNISQPTLVYMEAEMGGGVATTGVRRIRAGGRHTLPWNSGQTVDMSTGLTLAVSRGDTTEGYEEAFIEVRITPIP